MLNTREFWWIYANFQGRRIVLGPFQSEQEGNLEAYRDLDCEFEVIPLPTMDKNRASSLLKARRVHTTGDIGSALQRGMRKPPSEYKNKWWGGTQ